MLNNKGDYQLLTSFFFIVLVVVSVLVLIFLGLNSSVTASIVSKEIQPIQDAVNIRDSIVKCWGEFSFFELKASAVDKCFTQLSENLTGYKIEVIDFLSCNAKDLNSKEFGKSMNCKTKIPFIISLKKDEKTTCLGRLTLCFNESKRASTMLSSELDSSFPITTAEGCSSGQNGNYSLNDFEKIKFYCTDNYACRKIKYTIDGEEKELSFDSSQKNEILLYPKDQDKEYTIKFSSSDGTNQEIEKSFSCSMKGQPYVEPQIDKVFFITDNVEQQIDFANTYEVESRQIVLIKSKVNKAMAKGFLEIKYSSSNCKDENNLLSQETSSIGDFNYYSQWVIPSSSCNGFATGKLIFIDKKGVVIESEKIKFDINSRPFNISITYNILRDFNTYIDAIGRYGRITNIVVGTDLNKDSCYFTPNDGINWIKADWNDVLGGCDSGLIDLASFGFQIFSFNTKISNIFGETQFGRVVTPMYLDINPPSFLMMPLCPQTSMIRDTFIYFFCSDYPLSKNAGCGNNSVFYRIDGGDWNTLNSGAGKWFNVDGNYFVEAYSIDRFGYKSNIFSVYCSLEKLKSIYLRSAEIKGANLYLGLYETGSLQVDLYKNALKLDQLTPVQNNPAELILPVYEGLAEGDKLKICFPLGECSNEVSIIQIDNNAKSGLVQYCGGSFSADKSLNTCLFSDYSSINDLNELTCEYSLDGSTWAPASFENFNQKNGCKVVIPELIFTTHYVLFRATKNDLNMAYSPSSKIQISNGSVNITHRYPDNS
jgi:hypothetical protein